MPTVTAFTKKDRQGRVERSIPKFVIRQIQDASVRTFVQGPDAIVHGAQLQTTQRPVTIINVPPEGGAFTLSVVGEWQLVVNGTVSRPDTGIFAEATF